MSPIIEVMRWILAVMVSSAPAQTVAPSPPEALRAAIEKQQASIARQRESIRKQAETLAVWLVPGLGAPEAPAPPEPQIEASCDPIEDAVVSPIIESAAKSQALDPKLLRAVVEQESAYLPCAVSSKGARGLMQLMPDTGQQLGVHDLLDPKENVEAGAKYLKQLLVKYGGDLAQALGAYNAGPAAVDQAGGIPDIRETRDYVSAILKRLGAVKPP